MALGPRGCRRVDDGRDPKTGLPIVSLYMAEDRGPTADMLEDVDALVYDLPEVGGRTWTYVSTMALSMQADRPLEQIGAPWLDAIAVVNAMAARGISGVRF